MKCNAGPWKIHKRKSRVDFLEPILRIETENGLVIAEMNRHNPWTEGNASLIAAAPDLLAACHAFVAAHEKSLQLEKTDVALRLARTAIDKAVGTE